MHLEKRGLDVGILKDTVITRNFIAWAKEWEKEKHKKNDVVARALFVNKYKDLSHQSSAQSNDDIDCLYFIRKEDIMWCHDRDGGWTIFGQCEDPGIEEDKITPFLAVTLICDTVQAEGIKIHMPEPNSPEYDVYDPELNN